MDDQTLIGKVCSVVFEAFPHACSWEPLTTYVFVIWFISLCFDAKLGLHV